MFRRIVLSACLAGFISGLALTGVQMFRVIPIILEAETYEVSEAPGDAPAVSIAGHEQGSWSPNDGVERNFWTAFANILTAIGFALLLAAIYSQRSKVNWRQGLLWGAAGYAVFFINPSLGLTPEIPGTLAAALEHRQIWWVATVVCSALGLAALVFAKPWGWKLAGALLLVLPHLAGAPQPEIHGGSAPQALAQTFVMATVVANAIFWLVLGISSSWAFAKLAPVQSREPEVPAQSI